MKKSLNEVKKLEDLPNIGKAISADLHKIEKAIAAGAVEIKAPTAKPWGQIVSYVRCPDGTLVELCTPIS
jgi:hypothetical protein